MAVVTDPGVARRQGDWRERLRAAGLRVTQPRLAVLDAVHADAHLAADQVTDRVRNTIGTVSTQAVYDVLNTLTEHEILRRIEPAGSAMLFEINSQDNHHHMVCRDCAAILDVPCEVGAAPCAVPEQSGGFVVDQAEVTYWGVCPDCLRQKFSRTAGASAAPENQPPVRPVQSPDQDHQHSKQGFAPTPSADADAISRQL